MLNQLKFLILFLLLFVAVSCQQNEVGQIPVRDFFKTPEMSFFKISPDGKYISYLKPYKDKQNLFIKSLANGKEQMITSFDDYPVRDYFWTYNNRIIFSQDIVALDQFKLYAFDVATLKLHNLFTEDKVRMWLLKRSKQQPDVITISLNKRNPSIFDVYRLNTKTGELKLYIANPGNITEWFPDDDGTIRLAKASDGVDETILYRANENQSFKPIIKNNFKNSVEPIAFTGKGKNFYALSNVNRDKTALVEINAETGSEEKVTYTTNKADILEVGYSDKTHAIEYASWEDAKPHKYYLDSNAKRVYANIKKQLQGGVIRFFDRDSAERKFIISTYTDRNPGSYYLYDAENSKLTELGSLNNTIKAQQLCSMQPVAFKASDGLLINGYLTLPQGGAGKTNLPVVVMPHDGPWSRNRWGYNAEVQFLANRGYVVFQVNYRGSIGYGKAFYSAGFKQVGGKMQTDIQDGVKWLIARKIADPKRIALFGGGFGGFSALYGVSFHPELYNCAIVQYGLINFFTYIKDAPPYAKPYLKMTYEMVGNPETDASLFRAISPVFHADKINAPLLIFQGEKDPRANISELNQFVRELRKRNVPVTYVLKANERKFFRSEHNRMEMYAEIESFLDKNLKAKR